MADYYPQADLGEMINAGPVHSFEANNPITKGQAVKFIAVSNDLPKVDVATGVDKAVGIALKTVALGEQCPVALNGAVVKVTGSGAITAGDAVKSGAAGVVVAAVRGVAIPADSTPVLSTSAQPAMNVDAGFAFATALQTFGTGDNTGLILVGGMP